jgi:hypothetical protein
VKNNRIIKNCKHKIDQVKYKIMQERIREIRVQGEKLGMDENG